MPRKENQKHQPMKRTHGPMLTTKVRDVRGGDGGRSGGGSSCFLFTKVFFPFFRGPVFDPKACVAPFFLTATLPRRVY